MLKLTISQDSQSPQNSIINISRESESEASHLAALNAQGRIAGNVDAFPSYRIVLNDAFDKEDLSCFGRYGIIEFASTTEAGSPKEHLYISGGKQEGAGESVEGLLRLSREDHRYLLFLLRGDSQIMAERVGHPGKALSDEIRRDEAGLFARLLKIMAGTATIGSPFLYSSLANAQCTVPTSVAGPPGTPNRSAPTGSASGAGYSGIDSSLLQQQEGGTSNANVPTSNSGVTVYGLDLSTQSSASLTAMGFSQATIQQWSPFLGSSVRGSAAISAIRNNPTAAVISPNQQQQVYSNVYPTYYAAAAASLNARAASMGVNFQFSQMNVQWQTVVASMYFQAAGPTPSANSRFMRTQFISQVITQNWSSATNNLQHWNGPSSAQNNRAASNYRYLQQHNCTAGTPSH